MHFTNLLTSALLGVAAAASGPQAEAEDAIKIVDFYAIKKSVDATAGGAVTMVSFQINPPFGGSSVPIPCAATVAEGENELRFDSASYSCKTSLNKADQYSFKIGSPDSRGVFDITVSHKDGSKYVLILL